MKPGVLIVRGTPIRPDPRVEKIGRALVSAGFSVRALGWERSSSPPVEDARVGFPIDRLQLPAAWRSGLGNLPALLRWQLALARWLDENRASYQVIHACDFDTLLPALWVKRRQGAVVIYDIFDLYADMLRKTPPALVNAARRLELWGIDRADAVILADDARKEQIAGARPKRLEVIYNSPEDQLAALRAEQPGQPRTEKLRLAYVGLLQEERGLLALIQLVAAHPEWHLDLAGSGSEQARILSAASGLPNVTYHGQVPYQRALQINHAADVLPALYDPAIPNHRYASPNKLFEGMMLAKPVLVARGTNADRIASQHNCGVVIDYGRWQTLEAALQHLEDEVERQKLGQNGRQAYEQVYAWEHMAERLAAFYRQALPEAVQEGRKG